MTDILFLYGFNPYHNRKCIKYDTVDEYKEHYGLKAYKYLQKSNYNFNSNDGVTATITLNVLEDRISIFDRKTPDYLLEINA